MPRSMIGPFLGGLNLKDDPCIMDPMFSPNCQDVRFSRRILETRAGYRVLDAEPSYINAGTAKTALQVLTFDSASSESGSASFVQPLKQFWILYEGLPTETADGTYVIWEVYDGTNNIIKLEYIVTAGPLVAYKVTVRDSSGNTFTRTTTAQSVAAWGATRRFIAVSYAGAIYIGGVSQTGSTAGSSTGIFATPSAFYLSFDGSAAYCSQSISELVIVNRDIDLERNSLVNLRENESMLGAYFPIGYPVDSVRNDPDVLLHYTFTENVGATVYDWSRYGADMTLANTPSWVLSPGGQHMKGRGLGMGVWRRSDGTRYNVLGFTRNGPRADTNRKQGVIYTDKVEKNFKLGGGALDTPIYLIGGSTSSDDTTPALAGLDTFARMQFLQAGSGFVMVNGRDYARRILRLSWQYLGGTAPPSAPILTTTGTGSNWDYCYTYYNSLDNVETGRSPISTMTDKGVGGTVAWFLSSDPQFDKVRIYRTRSGGTVMYLLTEQAMAAAAYTDNITDAQIVNAKQLDGNGTAAGNRLVKRLYLDFADFRQSASPTFSPTARLHGPPSGDTEGVQKGPPTAPTLGVTGAGGSLSAGTYRVAYSYYNSTSGVETGMSPYGTQAASANDRIDVSAMVVPPDGNYDKIRMYRTKAGALTWYLDKEITAAATTTLTQADSALSTTIETFSLPPLCTSMAVFGNRLWMAGDPESPGMLYWSAPGDYGAFPFDNAHKPRGDSAISALTASQDLLLVHYEDGTIYALPNPGSEVNLKVFVPVNCQLYSAYGACQGQDTAKETSIGLLWLGRDGVYRFDGSSVVRISNRVTPYFRYMNIDRARFATAVWKEDESLYLLAIPRGYTGRSRLNDSWIGYYVDGDAWNHDNLPPCDVMGMLEDSERRPHYCFIMPTGILCELLTKTQMQSVSSGGAYDGCTFATSANLSSATACSCTALTYTASPGFDGGYSFWLLRNEVVTSITNHTAQRWMLRSGAPFLTGFNFYPMFSNAIGNTYKGYLGGIRSSWQTPFVTLNPEAPTRLNSVDAVRLVQRLDPNGSGNTKIAAVLGTDIQAAQALQRYPPVIAAPSTNGGTQHDLTLGQLVADAFQMDSLWGDWGGQVQRLVTATGAQYTAKGRAHALLMVTEPPETGYSWVIEKVAFDFTPGEET